MNIETNPLKPPPAPSTKAQAKTCYNLLMTQKQIEQEIKKIVFKYLPPGKYKIFLYGSRATNHPRQWSDYDIGVLSKQPIPTQLKIKLEDELEKSDLPVIVEVVDFNQVDKEFKQIALQNTKPWTN